MSDNGNMPALPGFDEFVRRDVDRAGAQDFTGKQYNAINIRRDYPQTYESVARALFFYKLPVKMCADLFRMNSSCVAAIRDQMIAASATDPRAAFLTNSRRHSQRDIVLARLTEAISEKLADEKTIDDMSVAELTAVLEKLEKAPAARNGTDVGKPMPGVAEAEVIEASTFDDALNGLDGEKKCARLGSGSVGDESGCYDRDPEAPGCSTRNAPRAHSSFEMSNIAHDSHRYCANTERNGDVCDSLCNSLCNPSRSSAAGRGSDDAQGEPSVAPGADRDAAGAPETHHGGAGAPAPSRAGGSTNNVFDTHRD